MRAKRLCVLVSCLAQLRGRGELARSFAPPRHCTSDNANCRPRLQQMAGLCPALFRFVNLAAVPDKVNRDLLLCPITRIKDAIIAHTQLEDTLPLSC